MFKTHYNHKTPPQAIPNGMPSKTKPDQSLSIIDLFERHTRRVDEIPTRNVIYTEDFIPPNYGDKAEKAAYVQSLQETKLDLSNELKQIKSDYDYRQITERNDLQSSTEKPVQKAKSRKGTNQSVRNSRTGESDSGDQLDD